MRARIAARGLLESVIVGRAGRLYFSSRPGTGNGRLIKVDRPGAPPLALVQGIDSPGGMVFHQRPASTAGAGSASSPAG